MLHAVIMAGGSGTRFWPASRHDRPKQLLNLAGDQSMIQDTVARWGNLISNDRVLIVTNQRLAAPIRNQLPKLPESAVLGEPCRRDTAPCIGLAAIVISRHDDDATMAVMPADHVISPDDKFQAALGQAAALVDESPQRIVTFGITPTFPANTFGYIERGEAHKAGPSGLNAPAYHVAAFHEKPNVDVAQTYLDAGTYYWNSGIFVWKARHIMNELAAREPAMFAHLEKIASAAGTPQFEQVLEQEFTAIEGKSIDYAVMEHAEDVVVIDAPFQWDDLGSWRAMARLRDGDENGNTVTAPDHIAIDSEGCIVAGEANRLIVTLGMKDCIVVQVGNATLVADKNQEERVREVVQQLEATDQTQFL